MNPHKRCLQTEVKNWNEPIQVISKSEDLFMWYSVPLSHIWRPSSH